MATPADRGWGTPGRRHGDAASAEYGRLHITTITTSDRSRFSVRKEVAPIFLGFLNEIIDRGYKIKGDTLDDWGWYVRPIAGSTTLSNHSWGLAIDVNALTNPMGRKLTTDMPDFVPEAATRWGLRWGGTYSSRPDAMHFEWVGTRDQALRFALDLRTLAASQEDDDMTDDDRRILREIHDALFEGVPAYGVPPLQQAITDTAYQVAGVDLPGKPSRIRAILVKLGVAS